MKKLLLLFLCATAWGQIAYVASTSVANPSNSTPTTTSAINTTGATLLVLAMGNYSVNGCTYFGAPTDSKSNAWTCAGTYQSPNSNDWVTIWYSIPTTAGAGHTFTLTGSYLGFAVAAFSGTASSSVLDLKTGAGQNSGLTLQPGTLTPSGNNELLIAVGTGMATANNVSSVDSPFSANLVQNLAYTSASASVALAYEIQTAATARNPTWAFSTSTEASATMLVAFNPAGAPSPAATPTFSPAAGTYAGTQSVSISTATSGCSGYIYWSPTNNPPTTSDTHSTSASVATSETIYAKVIGCPAYSDSLVGSAAYTIIPTCSSASFSPTSASVGSAASSGSVAVSVSPTGCSWTPSSDSVWLTVSSTPQIGSGPLPYSYSTNPGAIRSGNISVVGTTFAVTQAAFTVPAHTQHYPHISNGLIHYGQNGTPSSLWPSINTWLGAHFDWVNGGSSTGDAHGGNLTQTYYSTYKDMPEFVPGEGYAVQDTAIANGWVLENMFVHANVDSATQSYSGMDRFDAFEPWHVPGRPGNDGYSQGIFTYSGGTFADVSMNVYSSVPTTITSTLYVGYMEPFDQMNFVITTPRTGGTVAYNYWNGSAWTVITPQSDTTSGLTASGKVYWYPPSDWAQNTLTVNVTTPFAVGTTHLKYWVQVVVSGASTSPVFSTVKGDDWSVSSAGNTFRGWNATDSHRINVGTRLEYNPTPPSNASAKFRYQARATWVDNQMFLNPTDIQGGVRTAGRALADAVDSLLNPSDNFDAIFFDDATNLPTNADATLDYNHTEGWLTAWGVTATQISARLKSEHGAAFWVTNNAQSIKVSGDMIGDANLVETAVMPNNWWTFPAALNPYPDYGLGGDFYDNFAPASNPNNVKVYTQWFDTSSLSAAASWSPANSASPTMTNWHFVDRGNRTPLLILAMHYIGSNANTGFMYRGGQEIATSLYLNTDEVNTYDAPTTLASPVPVNTSTTSAKTITLASVDSCVGGIYPDGNGVVMQLGASGDVVSATSAGTVILDTTDHSLQAWVGYPTTQLIGAYPIQAGYSTPFSHLSFGVVDPAGSGSTLSWTYWNGSAQVALTVTDGTSALHTSGTITFTPPGDWATTSVGGVTAYWITGTLNTGGHSPTVSTVRSSDWKVFSTANPIWNSYSAGASVYCIQSQHLAVITSPPVANVWGWTTWFPAQGVDIGAPNAAGYRGGVRAIDETGNTPWLLGSAISGHIPLSACAAGGCPNVWRRDFTNGIVLMRPFRGSLHLEAELDTPSQAIALGGAYYPLSADGTLGPLVTSVSLRAGEAAILMLPAGNYQPVFGRVVVGAGVVQ